MLPVFNSKKIIISLDKNYPIITELKEKFGLPLHDSDLLIWILYQSVNLSEEILNGDIEVIHYLDRFYLYLPTKNPIHRKELFKNFFKLISEDYEKLIDVERNRQNIKNLIQLLKTNEYPTINDNSTILDYGCGTGLALDVLKNCEWKNIIGFDNCPFMRNIAQKRGMHVLDEAALFARKEESIDCAFASYVLHLKPEDENLRHLLRIMKPGSILASNFHKNKGLHWATIFLQEIGFELPALPNLSFEAYHGAYRIFRKPF